MREIECCGIIAIFDLCIGFLQHCMTSHRYYADLSILCNQNHQIYTHLFTPLLFLFLFLFLLFSLISSSFPLPLLFMPFSYSSYFSIFLFFSLPWVPSQEVYTAWALGWPLFVLMVRQPRSLLCGLGTA